MNQAVYGDSFQNSQIYINGMYLYMMKNSTGQDVKDSGIEQILLEIPGDFHTYVCVSLKKKLKVRHVMMQSWYKNVTNYYI